MLRTAAAAYPKTAPPALPGGGGSVAPTEIASGQRGTGSGGTGAGLIVTATVGATTGALVAVLATASSTLTLTDSTGAAWTKTREVSDHGNLAIFKRMVGSSPIVAGVTTFNASTQFGAGYLMVDVVNIPDATAIPTAIDSVAGNQPVGSGGSVNTGASNTIVAPGSAGAVQVIGYRAYVQDGTIPAFGSDAQWQFLKEFNDGPAYGNTLSSMSVVYRKVGTTPAPAALAFATPGNAYHILVMAEVSAPDTGDSSGSSGGGGAGGEITSAGQLVSVLGAGVAANGGKTYTLAEVDFGDVVLSTYNFSSNPITFVGQEGTLFRSLSFVGCHGLTFKDSKVYATAAAYAAGIVVRGTSTDIILDGMVIDSGAAEGTQISGSALLITGNTTANSNIQFIGRGDASQPDFYGYGNGCSITSSNGVTVKDVTLANGGRDGILIAGSLNVLIDGVFGHNMYSNIAAGDHPDWIQWFSYGGQVVTNLTIRNCGWMRGVGNEAQGYFGEDGVNVVVDKCWLYGGMLNAGSASRATDGAFNNLYLQGYADYGSRIIVRGGSTGVDMTNNYVSAVADYNDGTPNSGLTISGNTIIGAVTPGDYTGLDAWLAANPAARRRP